MTPRVLHVVLRLSPGGAERLVVDLATRAAAGSEAAVCCLDEAGAWAEDVVRAGVPVHVLGRQPGFHPSLARRLADLADRARASVLHCHQYSPFVYGALAGLLRPRLRVVFTEHGRLAGERITAKRRMANRMLGWRPHAIVAVCEDLRRHLAAQGFAGRRIQVIRNGIEVGQAPTGADRADARALLGIDDSAIVFGSVARLDAVKNLPLLVEAFSALRAALPASRLVIVGDGPERRALESAIERSRVRDRVHLAGERGDARRLMAGFDVYVNTSLTEGISLTILEAMAACLPVVATRVGGTPEITGDQAAALLIDPADCRGLVNAMSGLGMNPAERRRLGAAGRTRVETYFDANRMARAYRALYAGREAA